ncbi:MAG: glycosyltransferase [Proteobacteria bacterium]|nr:glycosyltransferase [Pseudomonadota bacterium]
MAIRGIPALLVGDLNDYSKSFSRLMAFRALGLDVDAFSHSPAGDETLGFPRISFAFRVAWKLGFHLDTEGANRWLIEAIQRKRPRIVWIEKGNMIRRSTLLCIKALVPDACIASYTDDDMFNRTNTTWTYRHALSAYDVIFTTKSYNANPDELPAMGARRVVTVDKAYDPEQHFPVEMSEADRQTIGSDVGFIGSFEQDRALQMLALARAGIRVRVWGNGWDGFDPGEPNLAIERRPLVNSGGEMNYTQGICATRINLAFLRKANRDLHTDRSIEIPACGAFMLAEYSDEHARLFAEDEEAAYFRSTDELIEKVRFYLAHEERRAAIAAAGRARCVTGGYRHEDRVKFMVDTMLAMNGGGR